MLEESSRRSNATSNGRAAAVAVDGVLAPRGVRATGSSRACRRRRGCRADVLGSRAPREGAASLTLRTNRRRARGRRGERDVLRRRAGVEQREHVAPLSPHRWPRRDRGRCRRRGPPGRWRGSSGSHGAPSSPSWSATTTSRRTSSLPPEGAQVAAARTSSRSASSGTGLSLKLRCSPRRRIASLDVHQAASSSTGGSPPRGRRRAGRRPRAPRGVRMIAGAETPITFTRWP